MGLVPLPILHESGTSEIAFASTFTPLRGLPHASLRALLHDDWLHMLLRYLMLLDFVMFLTMLATTSSTRST